MSFIKIAVVSLLLTFAQCSLATPATTDNPLEQLVKGISGLKSNTAKTELLPPDQAFQFFASVKDSHTLLVEWHIADGYYLYREKLRFEINTRGVSIGNFSIPHGEAKHDEAFGSVEIFHNSLSFELPVIRTDNQQQTIILKAEYQGCADRGVCYPPMKKTIELELPAADISAMPSPVETDKNFSEQDKIVQSLQKDSLWVTLLSFLGFGLLLSMTPCIFPMIPILSGIIVGHGNHITTNRAFLLSLSYVVASALTYTLFGVLAALFGSNLQAAFQHPVIIGLFSLVFVILSLSMFGFYHLELPNSIKTKLHNSSVKHQDGSLAGAAIMGSLSSLIVGPCVAAPLAGALVFIGKSGDVLLGGSALFALGFGMGIPLLILGASAGKLLPKAGEWMNATQAVFGVIMLAVAVWMLERVLPATIIMLLWALLLIIPSVYLSATEPLPAKCSGWRKLWKGLGLFMLFYGLIVLVGLGMGNTNPLKPLHRLAISDAKAESTGLVFENISSVTELEKKLKQAQTDNRKVMLDFYADWCISCKELEAYTFTSPEVKNALAGFMLLRADVSKNSADDKALLAKFNLIGPPAVLFFNSHQQENQHLRVVGYQDTQSFLKTLNTLNHE
jgi:thiol:disulfide interchange protein DsbD